MEVEFYLKRHPEIEEYVILEDDTILNKFLEHQVFIEYSNGLQMEHVEPAIRILNGNLGFYPPDYDRSETFEMRTRRILGSSSFFDDGDSKEREKFEKLARVLDLDSLVKK